jgi:hypothetical protein
VETPVAHHVLSELGELGQLLLGLGLLGGLDLGLNGGLGLLSRLRVDLHLGEVHFLTEGVLHSGQVLDRGLDFVVKRVVKWGVQNLLSGLRWVRVSGLASSADAVWIRSHSNISVHSGQLELSIFGWDDPLAIVILVWVPGVAKSALNGGGVIVRSLDVVVNSKVWHEVVHWMSLQLGVLVLSAAGG